MQVTDNQGVPVEGEFSLSVVDLASLALADPNAEDILPAFYSNSPWASKPGLSVAAYSGRDAIMPGGMGGGGGGEVPFLREKFPDTAYWNPSLITNSDGRGQVTMTLPDSLTTWQVDVRGLTVDTQVGQAENTDRRDQAIVDPTCDAAISGQWRPCADVGDRQQQYRE